MSRFPPLSLGLSLPLSPRQVQQLSPVALAYIGDAVYELIIRTHCLLPPNRPQRYHQLVVSYVRAETQASYARVLQPHLTESELGILKQGRNAASGGPKRVDLGVYQQATGFETLIGYLYLTNLPRLEQLLQQLDFNLDALPSP